MDNTPFLSVRNLEIEYTSDEEIIHAVNDVSFDINKGEVLGLVGETGAGKTTIAKAIIGILPVPPSLIKGGEIYLEGENLLEKPEEEMLDIRGRKISMIFQDPMTSLNPTMTIGDQIAEVIALHNDVSKEECTKMAMDTLETVGISAQRYTEYPFQFSGGMKQRVVIAMALACQPELILADEPTTALDVTIQAQILDMINDLLNHLNSSMLLITHDLGVVAETCDRVAVIYAGQIVEYGSKEDLFDHPSHPYTLGLFDSLPKLTSRVKRLSPIDGLPPDPASLPPGCPFHPRCKYATEACKSEKVSLVEISSGHLCSCINLEKVRRRYYKNDSNLIEEDDQS